MFKSYTDKMLEQARQEAAGYAVIAEENGDLDTMDEYADQLFEIEQEMIRRVRKG